MSEAPDGIVWWCEDSTSLFDKLRTLEVIILHAPVCCHDSRVVKEAVEVAR